MWEYNADENRFGTPEALMLLPYWTDGCIDSMEGLLFESSATTPYHFLNQAELSVAPSEPMVGLPYGPLDVPLGVEHLQLLGVKLLHGLQPRRSQQAATADPDTHAGRDDRAVALRLQRPELVDHLGHLGVRDARLGDAAHRTSRRCSPGVGRGAVELARPPSMRLVRRPGPLGGRAVAAGGPPPGRGCTAGDHGPRRCRCPRPR